MQNIIVNTYSTCHQCEYGTVFLQTFFLYNCENIILKDKYFVLIPVVSTV